MENILKLVHGKIKHFQNRFLLRTFIRHHMKDFKCHLLAAKYIHGCYFSKTVCIYICHININASVNLSVYKAKLCKVLTM